jgi:serine/threonine protein kinase
MVFPFENRIQQIFGTDHKDRLALLQNVGRENQEWVVASEDLQYEELLGTGGSAVVYRGKWSHMEVAIKRMHMINDPQQQKQILREAEVHR